MFRKILVAGSMAVAVVALTAGTAIAAIPDNVDAPYARAAVMVKADGTVLKAKGVDSVVRKDAGKYCVTFTDSRLVPGEVIPTTTALTWDRFVTVPAIPSSICDRDPRVFAVGTSDNTKAWADSGFTLVIN
ncbi:hypothetical protein [Actinokineospora diospyrosa]|uniref:Uncharacterized protein n=1 Tax=Actinokineospora diospyrosa TaxID=103728 RepID=A0ABT1IN52_9PSEU|nr:hypothetical protein [Actinokineospora diospyrosa]MCP2273964.1 hypothetical protein [Actinokineospora diospyrosa]